MRRIGTDLMATGVILGSVAAGAVATLAMVGASDRRTEKDFRRTVVRCETVSASQPEAEGGSAAEASGIAVKVSGNTITVSEHGSQRGRKKKRRCRRIVMPPSEIDLSAMAMVRAARAAAAVSESAANREVAQERLIRMKQTRARLEQVRAELEKARERAEEARAQADMAGKRMTIRCKSLEATAPKSGFSCWTGLASKR